MTPRLVAGCLVVVAAGCATEEVAVLPPQERMVPQTDADVDSGKAIMVDGFKLWAEPWVEDQVALRKQAAFDLECPAAKLHFNVLGLLKTPGHDDWASEVGVVGCEKRAHYSRIEGLQGGRQLSWVLQSRAASTAAPTQGVSPTSM